MIRQGVYQKLRQDPLGLRHQQCDVECISVQMREKLQGRCHIIPTIRTHNCFKYLTVLFPIIFSQVSRDWGRGNLACLGCRQFTAGAGVSLLVISNSVLQSSNSFCSWVTALSNVLWGKPSSSTPSSSCLSSVLRAVSYCTSEVSLSGDLLYVPSDVNKVRLRGKSH